MIRTLPVICTCMSPSLRTNCPLKGQIFSKILKIHTLWPYYVCVLIAQHYNDVIMSTMTSQITGFLIAYSNVCSGSDQRKYQSSVSLASVRGIHRWPVNFTHKGPVTRKMFPLDDVIMKYDICSTCIPLMPYVTSCCTGPFCHSSTGTLWYDR